MEGWRPEVLNSDRTFQIRNFLTSPSQISFGMTNSQSPISIGNSAIEPFNNRIIQ